MNEGREGFFHLPLRQTEDPAHPDIKVADVTKAGRWSLTPACLDKAFQIYGQAIKTVVPFSSCSRLLEVAKLLENICAAVNIASWNELKSRVRFDGKLTLGGVLSGEDHAFGFMLFIPVPGVRLDIVFRSTPSIFSGRRGEFRAFTHFLSNGR